MLKAALLSTFFFVVIFSQGQINPHSKNRGLSKPFFSNFSRDINQQVPSIGSFAISRKDTILYEKYFNGATDTTLFNVKSITKSILSALAGITKEKNLLPPLSTPVLTILPAYKPKTYPINVWFLATRLQNDSIREKLTLKDVLTMQMGLQWDDFGPVATTYVMSSDPVRFVLDLPFSDEPGETFNYCSAASSVFGAVLSEVVKTDLKEFANANLFSPLGSQLKTWDTDPTGRYVGASEIYLTTKDLIKFGSLYLNQGKVNGRQIIPSAWIKESFREQAKLNHWDILPNANGYGYYWWRRKSFGHQCYVASGAGGQLIYVIPDLEMVIATTCFLNEKNQGRSELKRLHLLIDKIIKEAESN